MVDRALEERAAIVAWLRSKEQHWLYWARRGLISPSWPFRAADFAEAIERGAHLQQNPSPVESDTQAVKER